MCLEEKIEHDFLHVAEHAFVLGAQVSQRAQFLVFENYQVALLFVVALGAFGASSAFSAFGTWSMHAFCSVDLVLLARCLVPLRRRICAHVMRYDIVAHELFVVVENN